MVLVEVFVRTFAGAIHVAWIPFALGRGNGVDTPVNEDAELRVFVPLRLLVLDERGPVGSEGSIVCLVLCFRDEAVALDIVLAHRLLPLMVDLGCGFDAERGCERVSGSGGRLGDKKRCGCKR